MTAALPRDAVAPLADRHWQASIALEFARRGARTALAHCLHEGPLVVQRPLYPEGAQTCHVILVHPPGGIAGGDRLTIDAAAHAGAHAVLTTPGAGKFYKSPHAEGSLRTTLHAATGAIIEWLPQETIIFDAANARTSLDVHLAAEARAIVQDIVVLGRTASGERFTHGRLRQALTVAIDGELQVDERTDIAGGSAWLAAQPGWQGQQVSATLIAAGAEVTAQLVDDIRASLAPFHRRAAVTQLTSTIIAGRYLGPSAEEARAACFRMWCALRPTFAASEAQRPRIWAT